MESPPAAPAPNWMSPPPQAPMGTSNTAAMPTSGLGLPPKRPPGQPPLTSSLAGNAPQAPWASSPPPPSSMPALGPSGQNLPSQSRLIPGSPSLPNMMAGGASSSGMPAMGGTLLGREVSQAPVSPLTQPLGNAPPLTLGAGEAMGFGGAASPLPTGRSIANLRTPRGTNFIRLAIAAVFLLGFLGLVGFFLKDHLASIFPNLVASEEPETFSPSPITTPVPLATTPSEGAKSTPSNESTGPATTKSAVALTAVPPTFDPTEPAALKAPSPSPSPASEALSAVPTAPANMEPQTGALLEVPAKSAMNADREPAVPTPPSNTGQAVLVDEEDTPAEAKNAIDSLKKFLSAGSLAERLQHTLGAEHMKPLMERYYTRSPDGPVAVDRIHFIRMDPNPELGSGRHCIFSLENKTWEFPVPVMMEEQADGFKVDWLAFVEFKDRLLEKFFQGYQDGAARFHVGIIRHHYFEDGVPNVDGKDAFRVSPAPPNSFQASVFLDKDSPLAQELRSRLPWETHVWAVVELEWKKLGSQQWVELSAVPQMHWYSLPLVPVSTPQKAPEEAALPPGIKKNGKSNSGGSNMPAPGIRKSTPDLPTTIKRPLPAGR